MKRISKSLAIASLAVAILAPVANDAQAWWGGPGWWGPYYGAPYNPYWGGYPYYGVGRWWRAPWRRWWW